jgi:acetaldehyde dehydrogenase (acetylating)
MGHTMSVHATDDDVVLQFGLHKPAFRIVVNTPTTHGSIGLTTGLDPAMTLGCGGFGGNITSDNISPLHLLNIKRVAYELRPASHAGSVGPVGSVAAAPSPPAARPAVPTRPRALDAGTLAGQIAAFLSTRGIQPGRGLVVGDAQPPASASPPARTAPEASAEVAFVCEDDVRQAIKAGRSIRLAPRAIVTPAARDLGDAHGIFEDVEAGLP